MFTITNTIHKPNELKSLVENIKGDLQFVKKGKVRYCNFPCSFDIETTSFYSNGEKCGLMYVWQFGINGYVFVGRTWMELVELINDICYRFGIDANNRMIVYVHNLAFEFQFMRKYFKWLEVFAIDNRKPIYATMECGIELRCSYLLSGYSLEKIGEGLQKYKCAKMVGDLDYSLVRHAETELNESELNYCVNDVMVVMCYIQEKIESDGDISKIPLTKTGYVRNYCRDMCLYQTKSHKQGGWKYNKYHNMIKALSIELNEYKALKRAFMGGFTHSNAIHTCETLNNVSSFDFTSSYPYCMISEMYPMGKGEYIDVDETSFESYLRLYCCVFDIKFYGLKPAINFENYISFSKCFKCVNPVVNNGRIVCADEIITTITNVDYEIISKCYTWERAIVKHMWIYQKGYLPTPFVKSIIKLYQDKTMLKGVQGMEIEYMQSKEMLNSCYGMCVTDIARESNIYLDDNWKIEKPGDNEIAIELEKYNKSKKRFLFYPWGIFVTAYARRNLFTGIMAFGNDYIYSDTDSIKAINGNAHMDYINKYNELTQIKLSKACKYHNIDISELQPKTIKGEVKLLGVWDFEGVYNSFKTLGAKRYMYLKDGKYSTTIAGTSKTLGGDFMATQRNPFEAFTDYLIIPAKYTGKLTHTYIDNRIEGCIIDYAGKPYRFDCASGIHLEPTEYSLNLSKQYVDYLQGVREKWK